MQGAASPAFRGMPKRGHPYDQVGRPVQGVGPILFPSPLRDRLAAFTYASYLPLARTRQRGGLDLLRDV